MADIPREVWALVASYMDEPHLLFQACKGAHAAQHCHEALLEFVKRPRAGDAYGAQYLEALTRLTRCRAVQHWPPSSTLQAVQHLLGCQSTWERQNQQLPKHRRAYLDRALRWAACIAAHQPLVQLLSFQGARCELVFVMESVRRFADLEIVRPICVTESGGSPAAVGSTLGVVLGNPHATFTHAALCGAVAGGHLLLVQQLLSQGARAWPRPASGYLPCYDFFLRPTMAYQPGWRPDGWLGCMFGSYKQWKNMLQWDNWRHMYSTPPIWYAAACGKAEVLRVLWEMEPQQSYRLAKELKEVAGRFGHQECVEMLSHLAP